MHTPSATEGMATETPHAFAAGQAEFARKLLLREPGLPQGIASHSGARPVKRFNIHRNNVYAGLTECIAARFPVVKRLVGEVFFRALAGEFVEEHPPRSPALLEYGDAFPQFLETFPPLARMPYLCDVARLEWACNVAYNAADAEPMAADALAAVSPENIGITSLLMHPSAQVVASPYPIVSIWETNTRDAEVRRIDDLMPGEIALVVRPRLTVLALKLGPGGDVFFDEISKGSSLTIAANCGGWASPAFALTQTLATLLGAGACVGFIPGALET